MSEFEMPEKMLEAANDLVVDQFLPYSNGITLLEGRQSQTDYLAHIDLLVSTEPRLYRSINDRTILDAHTLGIDWKLASYQNWHNEGWHTAPFGVSAIQKGQNTITLWVYEDEAGTGITGWIAVLWNRGLATRIMRHWDQYKFNSIIVQSGRDKGAFWYVRLETLLTHFRDLVLGYNLMDVLKSTLAEQSSNISYTSCR